MQVDSQSSDGDSSNEEEKSRISVIKIYAIVQAYKRAGWFLVEQYKSGSRYQIIQWSTTTNKLQPKNKNQNQIGTTATQDNT